MVADGKGSGRMEMRREVEDQSRRIPSAGSINRVQLVMPMPRQKWRQNRYRFLSRLRCNLVPNFSGSSLC